MEPCAAHESCGGVTVEAIQRCIEVAYILTDRFVRKPRVAARRVAIVNDTSVIHLPIQELTGDRMAGTTI